MIKNESYNFSKIIYDEDKFIPGTSYDVDWSLKVTDIEQDAKAVIDFSDRAGNDTTITIVYQRTKLSISNKVENWGRKSFEDPREWRELKLHNESSKPVVVDSLVLISNDKDQKWNYNGFTIDSSIYESYGGVLPGYTLQPGEELKFKASFAPLTVRDEILSGKNQFLDSIGIKAYWSTDVHDYCYFKYRGALKATIGTPCISIDRLDFGKLTVNNSLTKTSAIFNRGSADLVITGYSVPAGVYISDFVNVSSDNPLIIHPDGSYQFKVTFTPTAVKQFPDQMVFKSNADTTCSSYDPVLELIGEGIQPGIELLGYDWPKMRVHLPVYDQTSNPYGKSTFPYSSKVGDEFTSMRLSNTGNLGFTISNVYIKDAVKPEFFLIDYNNDGKPDGPIGDNLDFLKDKVVSENEVDIYPVYYDPKEEGNHQLTVVVQGEKDGFQIEGECTFRGTGVYPKGGTFNYMFTKDEPNQTALVDTTHKGYDVNVKFVAENWGEFADSLKIYDLKLVVAEDKGISTDISVAGDRLFAFNKDSLKFPIVLKPGDTLSFPAKYYPKKSSPNKGLNPFIAHVTFVTDADETNYTSEWTGKSISEGVSTEGTTITACVKYEELGAVTITNTADAGIKITNMYIKTIGGDSTALSIVDNQPFNLAAGESKEIPVLFKQDNPGFTDANIIFETSIKSTPIIPAKINCTALTYPRKTIGKINGQIYSADNPFKISFQKNPSDESYNKFTYSISLDTVSEDLSDVTKETNFYVEIVYNNNFLGADFDELKKQIIVELGSGLNPNDYVVENVSEVKMDDKNSKVTATIRNISGIPMISKNEIEILKLNFNVFLPKNPIDLSKQTDKTIQIKQNVTTNESCIQLTQHINDAFADPYAELQNICMQNLRFIQIDEMQFGISEVTPTPIGVKGGDINYSLGFDCTAEVTIYNSAGSAVAKPVNGPQSGGAHTVAIPIDQLASGVYFIELKAGPYVGTQRLVISK